MNDLLTILVVGAGRFAANYLKVLTALGRRMPADLPPIGKVVVSRTRQTAADETAAAWRRQRPAPAFEVAGAAVGDASQLRSVLKRHAPALTCITARDPAAGDDVHALYAEVALDHGAVLSEKNFAAAAGDGASLARLARLQSHPNAGILGLELPLAPLREALMNRRRVARAFAEAREIRFTWENEKAGAVSLVQDLALHPWSLLPDDWSITVDRVDARRERADIHLFLAHPKTGAVKRCRMRFQIGGRRRTLTMDGLDIGFEYGQGYLKAVPLYADAASAATGAPPRALCRTPDPIRQHILSLLRKKPLVGIDAIERSQRFLEQLAGYRPGTAR